MRVNLFTALGNKGSSGAVERQRDPAAGRDPANASTGPGSMEVVNLAFQPERSVQRRLAQSLQRDRRLRREGVARPIMDIENV